MNVFNKGVDWFKENRTTIEMTTGIIGFTAAIVITAIESVKFVKALDAKGLKPKDILDKEKTKEVIKTGIVSFKYGLVTYTASLICVIDANRITSTTIKSLETTVDVQTRALHNLRNEVVETFGEKKLQQLEDNIGSKESINGPQPHEVPQKTCSEATVLFHDIPTGRWFWSTIDRVNAAINAMDTSLNANDGKVPVSEWLDSLGLDSGGVWDYIYILGSDYRKCEFANTCRITHMMSSTGISIASINYYVYDIHGKEIR